MKIRKSKILIARKILKDIDFDSIAVRGISGIGFGSVLSYSMNKKLIIVRKDRKNSHGYFDVEASEDCNKFLIVDDFTSTGTTVLAIFNGVRQKFKDIKFIGTYMYRYVDKFTVASAVPHWQIPKELIQ